MTPELQLELGPPHDGVTRLGIPAGQVQPVPHQPRYPGKPFDHGLAWFRRPDADPSLPLHVEHYGAGAGFWNAIRLYPGLSLGMVVMANTTAAYDVDALFDLLRRQPW